MKTSSSILLRAPDTDPDFQIRLHDGLERACDWLIKTAMLTESQPESHVSEMSYADWRGAIRGEYSARTRQWGFFCPYWHTAQALKALLLAAPYTARWEAAVMMGDFLLRNRVCNRDDADYGLPLAYEDSPYTVNTSAILESLDAFFLMTDATGNAAYQDAAIDALHWVANRAYYPGKGLFRNSYDPLRREFVVVSSYTRVSPDLQPRPLLDDAVFLTAYRRSGHTHFNRIFFETAERLLATESPLGNWIDYLPCSREDGRIHPRHAFWWGTPMIDAWEESSDSRYRDCAHRAAEWYSRALRRDGGLLRGTYIDFSTDSFGHASSGSACAAILFLRLAQSCGEPRYLPQARKALEFCLNAQFTDPQDLNLKGAILEKVLPPDGTDRSPYHLRDLGTIFFIQAAALWLQSSPSSDQ